MTSMRLVVRSLWHYRYRQLGVVLASSVATAVLVGAFVVGDSVRHTLHRRAAVRIGRIEVAVDAADRYFRVALASDLAEELARPVAPVLQTAAVAAKPDGTARAAATRLLGVDQRFWSVGQEVFSPPPPGKVYLNRPLAEQLGVGVGHEVIFRVARPTALPRDVPLGAAGDLFVVLRLEVAAIIGPDTFGRFSLRSAPAPPWNAFVALEDLGRRLDRLARANLLLIGTTGQGQGDDVLTADRVGAMLRKTWQLEDLQVRMARVGSEAVWELGSQRVFLDREITAAARTFDGEATEVLTYFVNRIRHADRATPYSMVASMYAAPICSTMPTGRYPEAKSDGIILNDWTADDLRAGVGDIVEVYYYALGNDRTLEQRQASFKVLGIVSMDGTAGDPTLAPNIPGLSDAEHCRDWNPGVTIDLSEIREKDEAYWQVHRGTPKAFISLARGQSLWANPYGDLTAIRLRGSNEMRARFERHLLTHVNPSSLGFRSIEIRQGAFAAAAPTVDFAQLFLGMSFFIIAAALILTGFQFALYADTRSRQIGVLLAVGLQRRWILGVLGLEGLVMASIGVVVGIPLGIIYPRGVVVALNTMWREAAGGMAIEFLVTPQALFTGAFIAVIASGLATSAVVWQRARRPPRDLLDRLGPERGLAAGGGVPYRTATWAAAGCYLFAVVVVVAAGSGRGMAATGAFFAAGSLVLFGNLLATAVLLSPETVATGPPAALNLQTLAWRRLSRQPGRSMATISMIALGSFLLMGVNNGRLSPIAGADQRCSGTGGFALWAESTVPIIKDLNLAGSRAELGVDLGSAAPKFAVVALRVRDGDDASCLNLDTVRVPRVLGVDSDALAARGAFRFTAAATDLDPGQGWRLLHDVADPDIVPAVVDHATLQWGLKKRLGDTITYTDSTGRPFDVRLVATIADSILQGNILVDRTVFAERFADEAGSRAFLIDAAAVSDVAAGLTRSLADFGFQATPTVDRLAALFEVQNTYLSIFQVLGAIGMMLGCFGLFAVVWRNVAERGGEMAMMRALGFTTGHVRHLVLLEHMLMLIAGIMVGSLAALIAVVPAWRTEGINLPWATTVMMLCLVTGCGVGSAWVAVWAALRGPLVEVIGQD